MPAAASQETGLIERDAALESDIHDGFALCSSAHLCPLFTALTHWCVRYNSVGCCLLCTDSVIGGFNIFAR